MKADTLVKQLLFCVVRITKTPVNGAPQTVGTGFVFDASTDSGLTVKLLVTNKHVVADAASLGLDFLVQNGDNSGPELGMRYQLNIQGSPTVIFTGHPDPAVDVAVLAFNSVYENLQSRKPPGFVRVLQWAHIPTEEAFKQFDAIEELTFIGYPNGMSDPVNHTAIVRRAITATPLAIPFGGKPTFLLDGAVFGGSSGSPVFILDRIWSNTRGETKTGTRAFLIGIVASTYERSDDLPVQISAATKGLHVKVPRALNLGVAYSSRAIVETVNHALKAAGLPEGAGTRPYH